MSDDGIPRSFGEVLWRIWAHLWNNKQTYFASVLAILSFVQTNDFVKAKVGEDTFGWIAFGIACLMLLFARGASGGAVSSVIAPKSISTTPPSQRVPSLFLLPLAGLLAMSLLSGCDPLQRAMKAADDPPDYAFVLGNVYESYLDQAVAYKASPGARSEVVKKLQDLDNRLGPAVERLGQLSSTYRIAQDAKTEEELQAAVDEVVALLADYIFALREGKSAKVMRLGYEEALA